MATPTAAELEAAEARRALFRREIPLTKGDASAIRQEVATTRFLHLGRIALTWGITRGALEELAAAAIAHRRRNRQ